MDIMCHSGLQVGTDHSLFYFVMLFKVNSGNLGLFLESKTCC